jgi:predicted RNA-binding protein YlqC (UPF0109 family)
MSEKNTAVEFVRYVLQQICSNTDAIVIASNDDDRGTLITIRVAGEDMGRLIGKEGQTISALRSLISILSARENVRYFLKVEDPQ